jgi:hypothetical protein
MALILLIVARKTNPREPRDYYSEEMNGNHLTQGRKGAKAQRRRDSLAIAARKTLRLCAFASLRYLPNPDS